jgi:hypothetical protein
LHAPPSRGAPLRPEFADSCAAANVLDVILGLAPQAASAPLAAST